MQLQADTLQTLGRCCLPAKGRRGRRRRRRGPGEQPFNLIPIIHIMHPVYVEKFTWSFFQLGRVQVKIFDATTDNLTYLPLYVLGKRYFQK